MNGYDLLLCMNDVDNKHIAGAVFRRRIQPNRTLCAGILLILVIGVLFLKMPADIRYGCDIYPSLTIDGVTYMLAQKSQGPDATFVYLDTIDTANLSSESGEYMDAQIWISHEDDTRVYVKNDSGWELFVREELQFQWISYRGCLYVYEDSYAVHYQNSIESYNSAVLEDGAVFLEHLTFSGRYHLPTENFATNSLDLDGYRVFCCEGKDYLIVEVPEGLSRGRSRYDRYYPVLPDAVFSP